MLQTNRATDSERVKCARGINEKNAVVTRVRLDGLDVLDGTFY